MRDIIFLIFNPFLGRFASRFYQNIYCGKNTNYPLTTKQGQGDRFASCENIISRSQTSSLPPLLHTNEGLPLYQERTIILSCPYVIIQ